MKKVFGSVAIALLFTTQLIAQKSAIFKTGEEAIRGYDVVAYFNDGKAVKGDKTITREWNGAQWNFSSKANLDSFSANPEKYAPQYGGYCAYGTADGHKAPTDPNAWTILDGKLYFNYNKQVQEMWKKKQPEFIKKADTNWPKIKDQE